MERRLLATLALTLPLLLVAHASTLLLWRVAGRADLPPAEWVSAIATGVGLMQVWAPWTGRVSRLLPGELDHAAREHPVAAFIVGAFAVLAVVQAGRVSAFMVDGSLGRDAALPTEGGRDHQCLPAYIQAAELSRAGAANLYDEQHYEAFASRDQLSLLPPRAYANVGAADPMHNGTVRIDTQQERDVFGELRCTCGCPRDPLDLLSTCSCSLAEHQRERVRGQLAAGWTKDQISVAYQQDNGIAALALPPSSPPTLVDHMQEKLFDAYEYPPPFLVVPRAMLALTNDFRVMRTAWFVIQALMIGAISLLLARWIGGHDGLVSGLMLPAFWASTPLLFDLQLGQLHLLTLVLAMAGMAAVESRREVLGGALLGAAVVMKVSPGLLLAYLLARRQFRSALVTTAWIGAHGLVGLVVLGLAPCEAFVRYQLPRLASGEAFAFFLGRPDMLDGNLGLYALPLKLRGLGVPGMTLGVGSAVASVYGLLLLALTVGAARRASGARLDAASRWLAILNLAALRSPLAPYVYVTSGSTWLLTLLAAGDERRRRLATAALLAAWGYLALGIFVVLPPPWALVNWTVGQLMVIALNAWVALRRPRGAPVSGGTTVAAPHDLPSLSRPLARHRALG